MKEDIKKQLNELLKDALPESRDRFLNLAEEMEELGKIFQSLFENQLRDNKNSANKSSDSKSE
jgi:hypothetical protein